jgi:late competence protein required for DNA uptake (superfamily II DNA/RNA helicase)
VITEKLMIYALGRGTEYYDMPLIRSIVHDAERNNDRFSSLVLGVVKSEPFQMNQRLQTSGSAQESPLRAAR